MLYYLLQYLEAQYHPPGFQMIEFITVRATLAAITALVIALVFGRRIIGWLNQKQIGETIRRGPASGAVDHSHKAGTPTMGGLIMLVSILASTLLWGAIMEVYVWLIVCATVWMGAFGFADDYIKVVRKDKAGLAPRIKVVGQVGLGLMVGGVLYFHPEFVDVKNLTDLPFVRNWHFDYGALSRLVPNAELGWVLFMPVAVFTVTATSNAVNLTDGLDGLAAGTTAIVALGLVALCYISGNSVLAEYLGVMYLPHAGELTIYAGAMAAACIAFLWFNGYPATVFMGDTGALALGAAVATLALMVKKELLLPLLCAVFFVETLSVIIQRWSFQYTRKKTGTGRRVFKMAPLHHHFEAVGMHEVKIVVRFWIFAALSVLATLLTLRIQ